MHTLVNEKLIEPSTQLPEKLIALNQSVKGILPIITTQQVDDILNLNIAMSPLAWNWSKSFNY